MFRIRHRSVVFLILALTACSAQRPLSRPAKAQDARVFELRDGVIIDTGSNLAYLMNTKGGIDAIELAKGTNVWSTDLAAKPLALIGNLLICQAEPQRLPNELKIVALNVFERLQPVFNDSINLPDGVQVSIDQMINSWFMTYARVYDGDVLVSWEYSFHAIKGEASLDSIPDSQPSLTPTSELPRTIKGTVRIDISSRTVISVKAEEVPIGLVRRPPDLDERERLSGVKGQQFIAADSGHVLNSERVADDRVWNKHRWTIYDRSSSKQIAEIRNYQSYAPFVILGSKIIYESNPYFRRGLGHEPLKIRAVDLQTGQELWGWDIRDTAYRGPYFP